MHTHRLIHSQQFLLFRWGEQECRGLESQILGRLWTSYIRHFHMRYDIFQYDSVKYKVIVLRWITKIIYAVSCRKMFHVMYRSPQQPQLPIMLKVMYSSGQNLQIYTHLYHMYLNCMYQLVVNRMTLVGY